MNRYLLLFLLASGCFDFDTAYEAYCDGGGCEGAADGSAGGGGAAGGGPTGGGTTGGGTGGGGSAGGGSAGGGAAGGGAAGGGSGGGGGASADAGCPQFLCPEIDWASTRSSAHSIVAPGILAESLRRFYAYATFDTSRPNQASVFGHFEYRFIDGGITEVSRTQDSSVEGRQLRGVSMTDYWFTYRVYAEHFENNRSTSYWDRCAKVDGGLSEPWFYAVAPVSANEAWFAGYPKAICRWTRDGGMVEMADPSSGPSIHLQDIYRAPSGAVYAVGGDYDSSSATGLILRGDGSRVSAPELVDSYYGDGFSSVGGAGNDVWVLSRTGDILQLRRDGGFEIVHTAPFRLRTLSVTPKHEVWAVGASPNQIVYFDGGTWAEQPLPTTGARPEVTWEGVQANDEGVILSGNEYLEDGGRRAVVNTYRRFGR